MKLLLVAFQSSFAVFLPLFGMRIRSFVWRMGGSHRQRIDFVWLRHCILGNPWSMTSRSILIGEGSLKQLEWNPLLRRVYIYNIIHSLRFWINHCSVCSVDFVIPLIASQRPWRQLGFRGSGPQGSVWGCLVGVLVAMNGFNKKNTTIEVGENPTKIVITYRSIFFGSLY